MKIGIDISQTVYGTGVSFYTKELVRNLLKFDRENEYRFFGGFLRRRSDLKLFLASLAGRYTSKLFPFPPSLANLVWNKLHWLKFENLAGKVDVYHSSDWAQAPSEAFKVTTIHDLAPLQFPKLTPPVIVSAHKARLNWVKKEADRIIVPSNATKNDLIKLGFAKTKIRVIYEAAGESFKPASLDEMERLNGKLGIRRDYFLIVGVGGRKNTERAIKAFELIKAGRELDLVLVGHGSSQYTHERGVHCFDALSDRDLAVLYSGAKVFLYPSLYEGFGLPVLQAMACGTPVVTSKDTSMEEIAGGAVVLVDPYSVEDITEGINKAFSARRELVSKGLTRVKQFSWEKTALETIAVYKEAK